MTLRIFVLILTLLCTQVAHAATWKQISNQSNTGSQTWKKLNQTPNDGSATWQPLGPEIASGPPVQNVWTAMSTTGRPTLNVGDCAGWVSGVAVFWGAGSTRNGGRYNPVTNTWAATTTTNAPTLRVFMSCVSTGTELIVWGGKNGTTVLATGARYNPTSNVWTATSTTSAPSVRFDHTAVWSGTEMIVWGGDSTWNAGGALNTGAAYNPVANTWRVLPTTGAHPATSGHFAAFHDGWMYIAGGYGAGATADVYDGNYFSFNGGLNAAVTKFNPTTNTWVSLSPMPVNRVASSLDWYDGVRTVRSAYNSYAWYIGGTMALGGSAPATYRVLRYSFSADQWEVLPAMPARYDNPSAGMGIVGTYGYCLAANEADQLMAFHGLYSCGTDGYSGGCATVTPHTGTYYTRSANAWTDMAATTFTAAGCAFSVWTGSQFIILGGMNWAGWVAGGANFQ